MENLLVYLPVFVILFLISSTFHEYAHAWTASKLGDDTAAYYGRLTLNPIKHIDPAGLIFLIATLVLSGGRWLFGWAKPVPFNPYNLRNPKAGIGLIAAAGPVSNILQMVALSILMKVFEYHVINTPGVALFFFLGLMLNAWLAIFNLLPIPPLDGSKILLSIMPANMVFVVEKLERYSFVIIIVLWMTGLIRYLIIPVYWLIGLMVSTFQLRFPPDFLI